MMERVLRTQYSYCSTLMLMMSAHGHLTRGVGFQNDGHAKFHTWWRHQMETFSALLVLVRWIHRSPVNSPHKGQWRGALMFSLICAWINGWVNNREAGYLRSHRAHYVMRFLTLVPLNVFEETCNVIFIFHLWKSSVMEVMNSFIIQYQHHDNCWGFSIGIMPFVCFKCVFADW